MDVKAASPGVAAGDVLAGKYRVERVLGQGGMGVVVAAHHLQLDEKVALKFLLPEALGNPEALARFEREARAAVKIKSEHVARVSDVGRLDSGAPYMVMEYLEGGDLQAWLIERGPMPVEQAVEFVLQACEAIAEAHALGIVHRDLKPANLFCVRRADGLLSVKVLDFGISKVTAPGAGDSSMTRTSAVMGSPLYMSPEQIQSSKRVDARSDVWSLGVILYQLVSGQTPFDAEEVMELAVKIATGEPARLQAARPDVPAAFEQAVMRCLQKDRERRWQSVGELARALAAFGPARSRGSVERVLRTMEASGAAQAPPPGAGVAATAMAMAMTTLAQTPIPGAAAAPAGPDASWGRTGTTDKKRSATAALAIGAVAAVALLGGGTVVAMRMGGMGSRSAAAGVAPSAPAAVSQPQSQPQPAPPLSASAIDAPAASSAPAPNVAQLTPLAQSAQPAPATAPGGHASPLRAALPAARRVASASATPAASSASGAPPAKANCNPPYNFDAHGNKVYKQECM